MENVYLTSEAMYQIDQYTIEEIGIPSPVLMERAAYAVFLDLKNKLENESSILVVAGLGNNGGDAVALARMLFIDGYHVECFIVNNHPFSEGMAQQVKIAENIDLPITYDFTADLIEGADWIIEGLFGIGLSREMEDPYQAVVEKVNQQKDAKVVALDIPSGLSAATGTAFKTVVNVDFTYTFGFYKKGMDTENGRSLCGEIILCDLGYPKHLLKTFL